MSPFQYPHPLPLPYLRSHSPIPSLSSPPLSLSLSGLRLWLFTLPPSHPPLTLPTALIICNKWLISETGFHSTSLLTLTHMASSAAGSWLLLAAGVVPREQRRLTPPQLRSVVLLAATTTVSVAACMASLAHLPASFVQAIAALSGACGAPACSPPRQLGAAAGAVVRGGVCS
ncbi:hypothetical protein Agub_g9168 [Astrephomene gubernaculifera]|uniref:Uncharacterized protein n=1 Tax=Astrephomene gubernaculifera TaxID=47775 RepID=A0AAD3DSV6_9CHLO|nr:hypothetical protein Agub_g9168 [Astrephomene gubernaculifera]